MSKGQIIKKLQKMDWIGKHWRLKDFNIIETKEQIIFYYYHGDMWRVDKIRYYKKDGYTEIYDLNNYYGDTYLYHSLYI